VNTAGRRGGLATVVTAGLVAGASPNRALAYRPFTSTDAAVAGVGDLEIEFGPLGFVKEGPDQALVAPSLILNWGFADRWAAVLEGRHFIQLGDQLAESRFKVEEVALSAKTVLREGALQDREGVSVASESSVLLPTINGAPGVGLEETVIVSQRWPELTVHLNGAVAWTRAHHLGLFGGVILEGHDAWTVRPVAEIFVEGERDMPTVISGLVGAIWRASERLSFDAAIRLARAGGITTTEVRAGLTWALPLGWPKAGG
jgi:hypothetical protein